MKAIQLLINSYLPEEFRDYSRDYSVNSVSELLSKVAEKYPDKFEEISQRIVDTGRKASYLRGETITLADMRPSFDKDKVLAEMDAEIETARTIYKDPTAFKQARQEIWFKYNDRLQDMTVRTALANNNNIANTVMSGARGKPPQLKGMLTTPGIYTDYKDDIIPLFTRRSFGEGLRPAEVLAGTFGARKAVISTKHATAAGGDYSKQLAQATSDIVVTERDCGTTNGIDVDTNDSESLKGRVLNVDIGDLKAGTIIDKQAIMYLKREKPKAKAIVRSPLTCKSKVGICSKCTGAGSRNELPSVGDAVGVMAAQSVGEPITQMALNVKHQGGMASGKKSYAGFEMLDAFAQSPEVFPHHATVAEKAGTVTRVEPAPQGGTNVWIEDVKHYIQPGYEPNVGVGERVYTGHQLSEGVVDPEDIVRLKGLGEGRRYFASKFKELLADSGVGNSTRNVELITRGLMNHVEMDNPDEDSRFLPGDLVSYNTIMSEYVPPVTAKLEAPTVSMKGKYLHAPALHYSIGTKVTDEVIDRLKSAGVEKVTIDDVAPPFNPVMQRLRTTNKNKEDWISRMSGSYIKENLIESAVEGDDSNVKNNPHFVPRLAIGVDFGKNIKETGLF